MAEDTNPTLSNIHDSLQEIVSLLESIANGMSVMNIDNGYGAAIATLRIRNMLISKLEDQ